MARARTLSMIVLLAAGCSAQPATPVLSIPTQPGAAPTGIISVVVVRAPARFVLDGDLGEWGQLPSPPASLPDPDAAEETPAKPAKPVKREEPNPNDAPSHLAFALTGDAALIAARLGEPAPAGIWLGVGARVAGLPLQGQFFGNACFVVSDCETLPYFVEPPGDDEQGYGTDPFPKEGQPACRALLSRYAEMKAKHEAHFSKLFKIDREGVYGVGANGELVPIPGAKAVLVPSASGAMMEASLPLAALPRFSAAPIDSVRLVARAATGPKAPPLARGHWVWLKLPEAISFQPYAALRAHAFKHALDLGPDPGDTGSTRYQQRRGASYEPGDPLHIQVVDCILRTFDNVPDPETPPGEYQHNLGRETCEAVPREDLLFQKMASLGELEVGAVATPSDQHYGKGDLPFVAILRSHEVVELFALPGRARGSAMRGAELHILSYRAAGVSNVAGNWAVIAVSPSGARREVVVERVAGLGDPEKPEGYWREATDFVGKDLETFGWRGQKLVKGTTRAVEATFRWDEARKVYTGKQRSLPVPKKAKKPGR